MTTNTKQYAGFWARVIPYIIDITLANTITFFIAFCIGFAIGSTGNPPNQDVINILGTIINITVVWLYYAIQESSTKKATFGKRIMGLEVTDENSKQISFGRASIRFFGKFISGFILLIGFFMAGWTEKKQALHDIIAGCIVVKK